MVRRDECLKLLGARVKKEIVVCTIGAVGIEWVHYTGHPTTIHSSGAMGLATPIGLGLALALPERRVIVLEGDGAILMNLGCLATIAEQKPRNLVVMVMENQMYESSGRQPTVGAGIVDLERIARGAGIHGAHTIETIEELAAKLDRFLSDAGPFFATVKVTSVERVPHPKSTDYIAEKLNFMEAIRRSA